MSGRFGIFHLTDCGHTILGQIFLFAILNALSIISDFSSNNVLNASFSKLSRIHLLMVI